jgi:ribosome-associated toxin RatA of RatAB toxin-antitoxin module
MRNVATLHRLTAGPDGRSRVRRGFVVTAFLALSSVALSGATTTAGPVSVRQEQGFYRVSATFETRQGTSIARAVLTDYEQIPRFMPDVRSSRVVSRDPQQVVVEQEAVARVLFFSKKVHLRLVVRETDTTISFRDASGESFARYEGTWTLREEQGRAIIGYELVAKPAFDVPDFILSRLLRRDADRMIANLLAEMAARGAGRTRTTN